MNWRFMAAIFFSILCFTAFFSGRALSTMTGGAYEIYGDSFTVSQSETTGTSSGGISYALFGSLDGFTGTTTDNSYVIRGGFAAEEKGILFFSLSSSSPQLGALVTSSVSSATTTAVVYTDSFSGYTLSVSEDGNLRSGANDIDDVLDGNVTAGSEEYGILTSGTDALLSSHTAISGNVSIASATGTVYARATDVGFFASVSTSTAAGSYSHLVTFTLTVNP